MHVLYTNQADVVAARRHLLALGINGPVSADLFNGEHLPYADNLANAVVVVGDTCRVSRDEIERVLVPRGVCLGTPGFTKPIPETIDDWQPCRYSTA